MSNGFRFIAFVSLFTQIIVVFLSTGTQFLADFYLEAMVIPGVLVIPILSTIIAAFIGSVSFSAFKVRGAMFGISVALAPAFGMLVFIALVILVQMNQPLEDWMVHIAWGRPWVSGE